MNRFALPFILALAALGTAVTAAPAAATTVQECQAQIADLRAATADDAVTAFTSKQAAKEEAGLLAKLGDASAALPKKPATAIQKLADYRNHTAKITADGKLVSSADLVGGADAAIACIQAIG